MTKVNRRLERKVIEEGGFSKSDFQALVKDLLTARQDEKIARQTSKVLTMILIHKSKHGDDIEKVEASRLVRLFCLEPHCDQVRAK